MSNEWPKEQEKLAIKLHNQGETYQKIKQEINKKGWPKRSFYAVRSKLNSLRGEGMISLRKTGGQRTPRSRYSSHREDFRASLRIEC